MANVLLVISYRKHIPNWWRRLTRVRRAGCRRGRRWWGIRGGHVEGEPARREIAAQGFSEVLQGLLEIRGLRRRSGFSELGEFVLEPGFGLAGFVS